MVLTTVVSSPPETRTSPLALAQCCWLDRELKRGMSVYYDSHGYIHAVDVVPTFCHILGAAPPAQSQGTIAHDLFEGNEMARERDESRICVKNL